MTDKTTERIVREALTRARVNSRGFARVQCPFCETRTGKRDKGAALSVNTKTGFFRCWKCAVAGRVRSERVSRLADTFDDANQTQVPEIIELPEHFIELASSDLLALERARKMLRDRGCPDALWGPLGLGVCLRGKQRDRLVVPITDALGRRKGWVARTLTNAIPKYVNSPGMQRGKLLFNHRAVYEARRIPLLVVEGVFDAFPHFPDVVAVLGKPTEDQIQELLQTQRPVAVCLDGDAVDESWALAERLRFEGKQAGYIRLTPRTDPGDYTQDYLRARAWKAVAL